MSTPPPDSGPSRFHLFHRIWNALPFRPVLLLTLALFIIKEQFPFSHFPMYSRFGEDADVLFVAQQEDQPLAMRRILRTGTATAKKMYKRELTTICKAAGHSIDKATPEERRQAGDRLAAQLLPRLQQEALPPGTREIRYYLRTFSLSADGLLADTPPELLAVQPL